MAPHSHSVMNGGEGPSGEKNFRLEDCFNLTWSLRSSNFITPEFTISGNCAWREIRPESMYFVFIDDFVVLELKIRGRLEVGDQ